MLRPALVAAALIAVALSIFALLRPRAPDAEDAAAAAAGSTTGGGPGPAGAGAAGRGAGGAGAGVGSPAAGPGGRASPVAQAPLDAWVDPATLSADELEARRAYRLEQSRRARAAYGQYPPHSRPLRESEDLLVPEQVPPTVRPLAPPAPTGIQGQVVIRQTQDRVFLRPGTAVTVGLEATVAGEPVPVSVLSAVLVRAEGSPPVPSAPVQRVAFGEAGAARVASFTPAEALAGYAGDLLLQVDAEAGGERGALVYAFVYTGEPPAAFTGRARDRLEGGSVVFEAGVDVRRPGRYRITARVDDAAGKPLALARFDGELSAGAVEVPLVLFGKIARDEGGASPFVLRDVEGFRLLDGVYPDRETMATWTGPYRSRPYRAEELSPEPWAGGAVPGATPAAP